MSQQHPKDFPSYADGPQQPPQPPVPDQPVANSNGNGNRVAATAARTQTWWNETLHKLSLHARVTLLAAVAVGLAVAIVSVAAYVTVRQQMYQNLDNSLVLRASQAAQKRVLTNLEILQNIPPDALGLSDIQVGIITQDGETFGARRSTLPPMGQQELEIAQTQSSHPNLRTVGVRNGPHFRVVAVAASYCPAESTEACQNDSRFLQPGALVVAQSLGPIDQTLHNLGIVLWAFGLIGVIGAALAGNAVARSGLRPLARLTGAVEHVAATEDLKPIPVTGTDEISRLAVAFNAMLGALAQSRDRQRRLVGDAGHELRTPLTSVRTNLDLLAQADKRGGLRPEDRQQLLDDVRAQMDELTQLIGDLTELARDTPQVPNAELIELSNVVQDAVIKVRRRAPGLEWDVQITPFPVWGDERLLGRAVMNLLDNAAKYSVPDGAEQRTDGPPVGHVTVRLLDGVLTVTDSGPGIAEADLPHVFDRFYRSSEARSRPGSGLGLAIVKHAAELHGGMIYARNAPGAGAQFTLWLPHAATQTR
ncbi:two-component system sensor histidine kinase MprB [Kribbella aluminosa]|uniref:histidine kinase n=1 Tax=Kribbella aluminosa TaxID=416017 RepID=A0ABS4UPN3_9ACTN|nr:HAMP domain-containing sensor histidine kinase [Kribbella aluminosa]MBP2353610.1 two-component system sensor histidine kinase MprB [Kribbella aluminosa]